jgi:heme exporter protein A
MLEVRGLYCERDERILFKDLSFSLAPGKALQIQGSNGSGKTTLLRILCGLNSDFSGEILWQGAAVKQVRSEFCSEVFYLGHAPAINRTLSPRENLRWFSASQGKTANIDISTALDELGLAGYDDVPCFMMSAGQQRRVSLARMKLTSARLWVMDEPFTALDKRGVSEVEQMLSDFVNAGGSLILTTHHPLQIACDIDVINLDSRIQESVS